MQTTCSYALEYPWEQVADYATSGWLQQRVLGAPAASHEASSAIWEMRTHLARHPTDVSVRWELAQYQMQAQDYLQASQEYRMLLAQQPDCHAARLELVDCYAALHHWRGAMRELLILTRVPDYVEVVWQRLRAIKRQAGLQA